jgi:UDP-glucuronate 4-epimerase
LWGHGNGNRNKIGAILLIITGNKGFIGTNLTNLTGWDGFDIDEYDIRKQSDVFRALKGHDTVIHLAAKAGVKQSIENEADYVETNINGTYNVAYACWSLNKRLIFASSSSVYSMKSPYAKTKKGGEDIINGFARHGLDVCILRLFTVFGEHNRKDMAVYKFTQMIRNEEPIPVYGNCLRDFTYVQDVCKAIQKIAHSNTTGTHDLGFGNPIPVKYMIEIIAKEIGSKPIIEQKTQREFDPQITKADSRLMDSLVTQTPLEKAIHNTLKTI